MKVNFTGLNSAPETLVDASELRSCRWAEKGCFKSDYKWDETDGAITVTFTLKRLIDRTLTGQELLKVKAHETRHYDDYVKAATALKTSLQHAVHLGRPLDMDNRMEWFDWDVNQDSNTFHRSVGMMPIVQLQPSKPRPNP